WIADAGVGQGTGGRRQVGGATDNGKTPTSRSADAAKLQGSAESFLRCNRESGTIDGDFYIHSRRQIMAILATETASATAGREGKATSSDGKIDLKLSPPGSNGPGTNPEQLFAAGYSACFGGAIGAAA